MGFSQPDGDRARRFRRARRHHRHLPARRRGPVRLDLFGDVLDGARRFDPASQRTTEKLDRVELAPASEVILDEPPSPGSGSLPDRVRRRRQRRSALRGGQRRAQAAGDGALAAVLPRPAGDAVRLSARRPVMLDDQLDAARAARWEASPSSTTPGARRWRAKGGPTRLQALPAGAALSRRRRPGRRRWPAAAGDPAVALPQPPGPGVLDAGGAIGRNFAPERQQENVNLFAALARMSRRAQVARGGHRRLFRGRARAAGGAAGRQGVTGAAPRRRCPRLPDGGAAPGRLAAGGTASRRPA
jgi:transcription-repair coupling factor (superfamily II helicase)